MVRYKDQTGYIDSKGNEFFEDFKLVKTNRNDYSLVNLKNTEYQLFNSHLLKSEYELNIFLPDAYFNTNKFFLLLLLLDASITFAIATNISKMLVSSGEMHEVIIVGINFPKNASQQEIKRITDFTPTSDLVMPESPGGGATDFHKFINNEFLPFMYENYRIKKTDISIAGNGFGGLFTMFTLFSDTRIFN